MRELNRKEGQMVSGGTGGAPEFDSYSDKSLIS